MTHLLVETGNPPVFFTHLWADILRQHPSISISINCLTFPEGKWPEDGFWQKRRPKHSWCFMDLVWILLSATEYVKWASSVIKISVQKSGWASNIQTTVWPYSKRRGRSVGNILWDNFTDYSYSKCQCFQKYWITGNSSEAATNVSKVLSHTSYPSSYTNCFNPFGHIFHTIVAIFNLNLSNIIKLLFGRQSSRKYPP